MAKNNPLSEAEIINTLSKYLAAYPVDSFGLFGSFSRGDYHQESDIDVLVYFSQPVDLFTFARMSRELAGLFGRKVDLVTENSLHPAFRASIAHDLKLVRISHEKRPALS